MHVLYVCVCVQEIEVCVWIKGKGIQGIQGIQTGMWYVGFYIVSFLSFKTYEPGIMECRYVGCGGWLRAGVRRRGRQILHLDRRVLPIAAFRICPLAGEVRARV
jgi:hypothetical protein